MFIFGGVAHDSLKISEYDAAVLFLAALINNHSGYFISDNAVLWLETS